MIDIHQHLVFGVDDGSPDLETSLAMAEIAVQDGITHVVCTPHSNDTFRYPLPTIQERWEQLRALLAGRLELSLGCDFHLSAENIQAALEHPGSFSVNGNGYLLIEFSNNRISPAVSEALTHLQAAGYRLIVTHPERYPAVHQQPELMAEWIRRGCWIQVTANALYGRCGPTAEALANQMLERNWIHFLATDAHGVDWRPPQLRQAYAYVADKMGEETARRLCVVNPRAVVEGKPLPPQPEAEGVWEGEPLRFRLPNTAAAQRRLELSGKSLLARLLGRQKNSD